MSGGSFVRSSSGSHRDRDAASAWPFHAIEDVGLASSDAVHPAAARFAAEDPERSWRHVEDRVALAIHELEKARRAEAHRDDGRPEAGKSWCRPMSIERDRSALLALCYITNVVTGW
jgi:hypothetical protein